MTGQTEADGRSHGARSERSGSVRIYDRPEGFARNPRLRLAAWFVVLLVLMLAAIVFLRR
jgi:hypothetical protein